MHCVIQAYGNDEAPYILGPWYYMYKMKGPQICSRRGVKVKNS